MASRVVITGMGVVAPNGHGLDAYRRALCQGVSGITFQKRLHELGFACQVAGLPPLSDETLRAYMGEDSFRNSNSAMRYATVAAIDCWRDAGLAARCVDDEVDWSTGAVIGTCAGGIDTIGDFVVPETLAGRVKRLGSSAAERAMSSCVSASVGGHLGLGGQVTTNSSACSTGTEAIIDAYWMVREGRRQRMIAGSSEGSSLYIWACLDGLRVTSRRLNESPENASRPLSATASGLVPSCGAGMLMLESLESASERGARIYAEVLGGAINSGGQRNGGSITASNPEGVVRCVSEALETSKVRPNDVDYINGHLTSTTGDAKEIRCLSKALRRPLAQMPWVNATKSMIGHSLGASGSLESVATVLQLFEGFVHPSLNCEDFHPEIAELAPRVPCASVGVSLTVALKTSFGFGDVNCCLVLGKWTNSN